MGSSASLRFYLDSPSFLVVILSLPLLEHNPTPPNVARIFDIMSLTATSTWPSETLGRIPFSPFHHEFEQQYYWRLPMKPNVVLSGLMASVMDLDPHRMEIGLTQVMRSLLTLSKFKARHGLVDRLE